MVRGGVGGGGGGGGAEAQVSRSEVSFRLDQKTENFKAAISSRLMQWSASTEEKQKNQLSQTKFRFVKRIELILIMTVAAITICPSPPNRR
jgi:hypothetical protein